MNLSPVITHHYENDDGTPMVGGFLYSFYSGTETTLSTYQDEAGTTANTNPIVLDARGECQLRLDPTHSYRFRLKRADGTTVWTRDDVEAVASALDVVTSVNDLTGDVTLTAAEIPFTTSTSTTWFVGTDVSAGMDAVITKIDSGQSAAQIAIADAGSYYTGTSVEAALQELGARTNTGALLRITTFTSTGTWTKGSDVGSIVVEGVGAGGGVTNDAAGRGGGGAGAYFIKRITSPSASYAVTIGASAVGADGGNTTFGSVGTAGGGKLGPVVVGGLGGTASGGDLNLNGGGGGFGGSWSANVYFGAGGNSFYGGGAVGNINNATGSIGQPSTGGGASGGTTTGAAGGSGVVIVYEYT